MGGRGPWRMHLEDQRSAALAREQRGELLPGNIAAAGGKMEVEPQRVELRKGGVASARAEVVVQVEDDRAIQRRLDQLHRVGVAEAGDDVGVADVEAEADGG